MYHELKSGRTIRRLSPMRPSELLLDASDGDLLSPYSLSHSPHLCKVVIDAYRIFFSLERSGTFPGNSIDICSSHILVCRVVGFIYGYFGTAKFVATFPVSLY